MREPRAGGDPTQRARSSTTHSVLYPPPPAARPTHRNVRTIALSRASPHPNPHSTPLPSPHCNSLQEPPPQPSQSLNPKPQANSALIPFTPLPRLHNGPLTVAAMAMAMLGSSASLSSQLCSVSGRTPAVSGHQVQAPGAFSLKRSGTRGIFVRAQQGRGSGGDPESKQLLDAFFLGKALAETVSERIGSLVGELLSEVGQRQAEQQRQIREFQNEVQERARTSAMKAAQKALATENTVSRAAATQTSTVTYDDEPRNGSTVTESTTSATEGANGLPSLPYDDLPPLDPPSTRPSEQGTPDF